MGGNSIRYVGVLRVGGKFSLSLSLMVSCRDLNSELVGDVCVPVSLRRGGNDMVRELLERVSKEQVLSDW